MAVQPTAIKIPDDIKWKPAIAFNKGRNGKKIKYIIIHSTEGSYQSSVDWLRRKPTKDDEGSSVHYVINELGTEISQLVKDEDTAWHAGNLGTNREALGVEHSWYSESWKESWQGDMADGLYRTGARLTAYLCYKYNLVPDRNTIIGHYQVPPPNNHKDPNKDFNWTKYMAYVAQEYGVLIKPTTLLPFSQTFEATGYTVDDTLGFLSFWRDNGGLPVFGYPISGVKLENGKQVQWFERARFESLPDKKVQLGLLGSEILLNRK